MSSSTTNVFEAVLSCFKHPAMPCVLNLIKHCSQFFKHDKLEKETTDLKLITEKCVSVTL